MMGTHRLCLLAAAAAAAAAAAMAAPGAASAAADDKPIRLFLLPHTHADVGWLETPENLARVNVSRILDGVTGNLANDTKARRRFVWDEMYFLQWWWQNRATELQQVPQQLVHHHPPSPLAVAHSTSSTAPALYLRPSSPSWSRKAASNSSTTAGASMTWAARKHDPSRREHSALVHSRLHVYVQHLRLHAEQLAGGPPVDQGEVRGRRPSTRWMVSRPVRALILTGGPAVPDGFRRVVSCDSTAPRASGSGSEASSLMVIPPCGQVLHPGLSGSRDRAQGRQGVGVYLACLVLAAGQADRNLHPHLRVLLLHAAPDLRLRVVRSILRVRVGPRAGWTQSLRFELIVHNWLPYIGARRRAPGSRTPGTLWSSPRSALSAGTSIHQSCVLRHSVLLTVADILCCRAWPTSPSSERRGSEPRTC